MAEIGDEDNPNELLEQISSDEKTADVGNETSAERDARTLRNQKCATSRRRELDRQQRLCRDLNVEFAAAG